VTAGVVRSILDAAFLLAMAGWLGSLLFVSFGVVPVLRRHRGDRPGPEFWPALLGRLYLWGATCGAIALPASLGAPLAFPTEYRGPWVGVEAVLLIAATLAMLYGSNSLVPKFPREAQAGPDRTDALLTRCIRLNAGVVLLGSALLVAFAFRPAPRTAGIIEPTPQERARRAYEAEAAGKASRRPGIFPPSTEPAELP
jgi:hypothetical protein